MMDALKLEKLFVLLGGLACDQSTVANNFSMAQMAKAPRDNVESIIADDTQIAFAGIAAQFRENDLEANHDVIMAVAPKTVAAPVQKTAQLYAASVAGFNRMASEVRRNLYATSAHVMTFSTSMKTAMTPQVEKFTNHAANVLPFKRRQLT